MREKDKKEKTNVGVYDLGVGLKKVKNSAQI